MLATSTEGVYPSSTGVPKCSTLPPELLSQIFRHYLQMSPPYNPETREVLGQRCLTEHLLLVCKSWHDAARGDSSLWREIILDPEITRITPYRSLQSYTKVRITRSRSRLLHISINNNSGRVGRVLYSMAYYHLMTTISRWERLFYYFRLKDAHSCIPIRYLVASTPHLRELVVRTSIRASIDFSQILPETPSLQFLEVSIPRFDALPPSLCGSVTIASIQSNDLDTWITTLSRLKSIHTLILQCFPAMTFLNYLNPFMGESVELPSVQTLILIGPLWRPESRLRRIKFPALQILEVDLSPSDAERQWSEVTIEMRERLKSLLTAGLQKFVLKSVWFDQWADLVNILQDTKEWVGELVCVDVRCTLGSDEERKVVIDLGANLTQRGVVCPAAALSVLNGFLEGHSIERSK
jgi:F-box-like